MKENNALLRLDGVGFKTDDAVILHNINFQLRAGEFKLITALPAAGKVSPRCSAQPPGACSSTMRMSRRCRRKDIANSLYCAQTPALFGDSVYDNLIFRGRSAINNRIRRRCWPTCSALALTKICWKNPLMNSPAGSSAYR